MSAAAATGNDLQWDVLTIKRPGLTRDLPPGKEDLMWVANSSTLIYGKRDAVLVDTFLTTEQSRTLLDRVVSSGKNLVAIYITHGHGDHFFGLASLLERFPRARAVARRPRSSRPCTSSYRPPGSRSSGAGFSLARYRTASLSQSRLKPMSCNWRGTNLSR
jgi:glyoxylase-like metal-dependent hydrolase (beta-lactamase superfamily II)